MSLFASNCIKSITKCDNFRSGGRWRGSSPSQLCRSFYNQLTAMTHFCKLTDAAASCHTPWPKKLLHGTRRTSNQSAQFLAVLALPLPPRPLLLPLPLPAPFLHLVVAASASALSLSVSLQRLRVALASCELQVCAF